MARRSKRQVSGAADCVLRLTSPEIVASLLVMRISDAEDADRSNHRAVHSRLPRVKRGGAAMSAAQLAAYYSRNLAIRGKLRSPRAASRETISASPELLREWRREEFALMCRMARPGE